MQQKTKDLFSQGNGGQTYETYRPKYPKKFIDEIVKFTEGKKNYLDLATGTGQILFEVYPYFSELCVGIDISESQLAIAKQKLVKIQRSNTLAMDQRIELINGDAYNITEELTKRNMTSKFDLITIGEALHWFDTEELFHHITDNLMEKDARFCILNYNTPYVEYNVPDEDFRKRAQFHFDRYFETIKSYFEYNLESFFLGYEDLQFEKYFKNVKQCSLVEKTPVSIDAFVGYYQTYSGHMTYVKKHKDDEDFQDPAALLKLNLEKRIERVLFRE